MFLIVGLGNPGKKYVFNRHNIGFLAMDALVQAARDNQLGDGWPRPAVSDYKVEHNAATFRLRNDVLIALPQTFMNLSGEAVQPLMAYYKIPIENVLVVHDEIDIPFGHTRFQKGRGAGGHNGIKNIHEKIGPEYARLRLGVGRPTIPQMDVATWVLQNFTNEEMDVLPDFLGLGCEAVLSFIEDGFERAQNTYNSQSIEKKG